MKGWIIACIAGVLLTAACRPQRKQRPITPYVFSEKLSDYGFFRGTLKQLLPAPGVQHYELSTPLFTDYAVKDRFIVLPAGRSIQYTATGAMEFPDSAFIIKNFAYTDTAHQRIMIETRLLHKDPYDGQWKVMNYLWNAEQTEAVKWISGKKVPITLLNDQQEKLSTVYYVPNTNDCKRCHSSKGVVLPIGPKARNLNFTLPGANMNQLLQWAGNGMLKGMPALADVPLLPKWNDSIHFNIDQRARAYLDVNCAHCHIKGGDADNTGLFLEYEQSTPNHLGILKSPISAGAGAGGLNYDILPGDAAHSILAYRMNSTEPGTAMPELARTLIHKEGVALIREWINQLPAGH